MKTIHYTAIAAAAWLIGLIAILLTSFFSVETPGFADVVGFGGILLFGSFIMVAFIYIPALFFLRKIVTNSSPLTPSLMLAGLGNLPLYFLIAAIDGTYCARSESLLFTAGFAVVAVVFGAGYSLLQNRYPISKGT